MEKVSGKKLWLVLSVAAIVILSLAVTAGAGNLSRKLYGDYSANFMLSCGGCSVNFGFPYGPMAPVCNATSTTYTWNVQGIYTFDGSEGVEFTGRYLGVLRDPLANVMPVVLPPRLKCESGIYAVNNDRIVAIGFDSCFVYGDELGATPPIHRIDNVNLRGQLLDRMDGPVLLLSDTLQPPALLSPNVETVITYPPLVPSATTTYRICGLTGTAIPIKGIRMKRGE
jgi:hypothetical protein